MIVGSIEQVHDIWVQKSHRGYPLRLIYKPQSYDLENCPFRSEKGVKSLWGSVEGAERGHLGIGGRAGDHNEVAQWRRKVGGEAVDSMPPDQYWHQLAKKIPAVNWNNEFA